MEAENIGNWPIWHGEINFHCISSKICWWHQSHSVCIPLRWVQSFFINAHDVKSTTRRAQPQKYAFRLIVQTNDDITFEEQRNVDIYMLMQYACSVEFNEVYDLYGECAHEMWPQRTFRLKYWKNESAHAQCASVLSHAQRCVCVKSNSVHVKILKIALRWIRARHCWTLVAKMCPV